MGQQTDKREGPGQVEVRTRRWSVSLVWIVPILAIYPLILKFFTKGTMSGALKG